jgi:hypothetical protein
VTRRAAPLCVVLAMLAACAPHRPPAALPSRPAAPTASPPTTSPPSAPAPTTSPAVAPPLVLPTLPSPAPTTPGFPEASTVGCAGRPGERQVVALVRAQGMLDAATSAKATVGPLCAGTWQYTILAVPQREPLQVVSQGPPTALVLVTAGTDVCTDAVRAQAPPGILAAAHC